MPAQQQHLLQQQPTVDLLASSRVMLTKLSTANKLV
jgi:hypothetical protein